MPSAFRRAWFTCLVSARRSTLTFVCRRCSRHGFCMRKKQPKQQGLRLTSPQNAAVDSAPATNSWPKSQVTAPEPATLLVRSASHRCGAKIRQVCGTCVLRGRYHACWQRGSEHLRAETNGSRVHPSPFGKRLLRMCQAPLVTPRSHVKHGAGKRHFYDKPRTCCSEAWSIGPVAQWIRHRPTEPGIAGWSPAGVMFIPPTMQRERRHSCAVNVLSRRYSISDRNRAAGAGRPNMGERESNVVVGWAVGQKDAPTTAISRAGR